MIPLTPKKRSELRAEAHKLSPIVIIGDKGLTDEVLAEIDRSLKAHELIKVRAATDERDARDVWLETICEKLEAHPVQQIGKVFVIFRENPEGARDDAEQAASKAPERKSSRPAAGVRRPGVVTQRGKLRQNSRDLDKRRALDVKDMIRKGKIKPKAEPGAAVGRRAAETAPEEPTTRTSRPRSRPAARPPASEPRRRRPRTSR